MNSPKTPSRSNSSAFFVEGMCCMDEQHAIEKKLRTIPGIQDCRFNLVNQKLSIVHTCPKEDIQRALHGLGFKVREQMHAVEQKSFWEKYDPDWWVANRDQGNEGRQKLLARHEFPHDHCCHRRHGYR